MQWHWKASQMVLSEGNDSVHSTLFCRTGWCKLPLRLKASKDFSESVCGNVVMRASIITGIFVVASICKVHAALQLERAKSLLGRFPLLAFLCKRGSIFKSIWNQPVSGHWATQTCLSCAVILVFLPWSSSGLSSLHYVSCLLGEE